MLITSPGGLRDLSQQPGICPDLVLGIVGSAHHVAVFKSFPPKTLETNCHGGTLIFQGFDII